MDVKGVIFILVLICHRGLSLRCYSCTGRKGTNPVCEHPSDHLTQIEQKTCDENYICVHYVIQDPSTSVETITRDCKTKTICEKLKDEENQYSKVISCKTCDDNLCNTAKKKMSSLGLILLFIVIHKMI